MPNFAAAGSVATKLGISSVYSYFEQMGAKPGEEFSEAIHLCDKQGIPLICGDRKIEDTVNELQSALFEDLPSILGDDGRRYKDIGERDDDMDEIKRRIGLGRGEIDWRSLVENMKDRKTATLLAERMGKYAPHVREVILTKRDKALAQALIDAPYTNIVGVVALAHMDGIERIWVSQ